MIFWSLIFFDTIRIHLGGILYIEVKYLDVFWAYRIKHVRTARENSGEQVACKKNRAYREKLACSARENSG